MGIARGRERTVHDMRFRRGKAAWWNCKFTEM